MRESGSDSNMPFEGNSAEERFAQHPANPAMRRFERSPEPRPVKREGRSTPPRPARLQQRTRPSESPRAQKSPLPLRARSLNDRTARPSEPRVSGSIAAGRRNRDSRRQNSLFGFRKPAATAPKDRPEQRRRSRSSRFSSQNSPRPIVAKPFRPTTRSEAALLYGTRLLILGVGVGVIAGTILSIWDPASNFTAGASSSDKTEQASPIASPAEATALRLDQEILPLKNQIQTLVAQQPQLTTGMMVVDLDTNAYLSLNAATALPCASTIKLPVLVAFFQDVDAGKIRLDELLTMRPDLVATEAGDMQYQPPGSQFTALDIATHMITVSDNTATNLLIDRLGGKDALNQRFQSWGLKTTAIRNLLPDIEGTNTSSPQDLVSLMGLVSNGKLLSIRSRDRLLDIMRRTVTNSLLPSGLGAGATIAHKTGNIGTMTGDVGLVDMPSGKRYLIGVMVKRPRDDERGEELIRQASRLTYQYFSQPVAPPAQPQQAPVSNPQGAIQPRSKIAQP